MTITNFLNKIKSEKYVQKITDAIHDAIEQTYEDATKEGNANMEVSQARGTFSTLNNRLNKTDDDVKETNRQLAQKANQTALEVEKNRINNLVANAGDTDGNAELLDIRVGIDGTVYKTAGEAVRNVLAPYMIGEDEEWII